MRSPKQSRFLRNVMFTPVRNARASLCPEFHGSIFNAKLTFVQINCWSH